MPLETLDHSILPPPHTLARKAAAEERPWLACPPATVRSSAVRLENVGHIFLPYHFPSNLFSPIPVSFPTGEIQRAGGHGGRRPWLEMAMGTRNPMGFCSIRARAWVNF
jgi:hypothetical protein